MEKRFGKWIGKCWEDIWKTVLLLDSSVVLGAGLGLSSRARFSNGSDFQEIASEQAPSSRMLRMVMGYVHDSGLKHFHDGIDLSNPTLGNSPYFPFPCDRQVSSKFSLWEDWASPAGETG